MSYSNFGKQHNGRGLKAFVIVVCVLLVVAIVASALVLWRTTNHYTELPEFNDEDGVDFSFTDDEEFNENPYSDDDEPDLSGGSLDVEFESFSDSGLSFEVSPLSSDVSSYAGLEPLNTAAVKVTADFDLSLLEYEWYLEADDSFYYDGTWHDGLGYPFADDFGKNIDSYLKIADENYDSCVVEFWDYFPATTYLYYRCWNKSSEVVGRVLVDCVLRPYTFSNYLYVGDVGPSFKISDYYNFNYSAGFYSDYNFFDVGNTLFNCYYDGSGNIYNCLFFGRLDSEFSSTGFSSDDPSFSVTPEFIIGSDCKGSGNTVDLEFDLNRLFTYTYSTSYSSVNSRFNSGNLEIASPVLYEFPEYYGNCCRKFDPDYADLFCDACSYILNSLGVCVVPYVSSYSVGSYLSDSLLDYMSVSNVSRFYSRIEFNFPFDLNYSGFSSSVNSPYCSFSSSYALYRFGSFRDDLSWLEQYFEDDIGFDFSGSYSNLLSWLLDDYDSFVNSSLSEEVFIWIDFESRSGFEFTVNLWLDPSSLFVGSGLFH